MPTTACDAQIYYETRGPDDGIPLLFVQGFTAQLVGWREGFCRKFVERGARVILFDNRDVGLSRKYGGQGDFDGGYSLHDMAADGFAVLDDLGLDGAHLVGASMGGMIAQCMALAAPSRVRSLNLIYTTPTFDPDYFVAESAAKPAELAARHERETAVEAFVERERYSASPGFAYDEHWVRELGAIMYDRCYAPEGLIRQAYAMTRWVPQPDALGNLDMPCSIIHGRGDARVRVQAAFDLERLLKDAELHIYPGLGHEIPEPLWGEFAAIIMRTARRSAREASAMHPPS
jgi:pimeloyl-ACP methyl ester carboxylesterase